MADELTAMKVVAAHVELAKAKSLRERAQSHGHRMSLDAKELLWAMIFAHEEAASELIESAKAD